MSIKITTILENHSDKDNKYLCEHGLSLFIETDRGNLLFDSGQSDIFLENAKRMNIDLSKIDSVILSHGHYDHTGGIIPLIRQGSSINNIYIGKGFFYPKYKTLENNDYKYNGIPFDSDDLINKVNIVDEDIKFLNDDFIIFRNFKSINSFEKLSYKFTIKKDDKYIKDNFNDEIVLGIKTNKGIVLLVGCSHIGIVNIISTIKEKIDMPISGIIGGSHLINCNKERLNETIKELKLLDLDLLSLCHCTGDDNIAVLEESFNKIYIKNVTGTVINID